MADYMKDPTKKVWLLFTKTEYINGIGQRLWSEGHYRGPYFSLKAAERQVKNQQMHPQYIERMRKQGEFVGDVRVQIVEMVGVLSVVDTIEWTP